jgi:hypothetical protein
MKKILFAITAICIFSFLNSCKSKSGSGSAASSPTAALAAMATDSKEGDMKAMAAHLCKPDKEMMEKMIPMIEAMAKKMGMDIKQMMKQNLEKNGELNFNDVSFANEKVTGDKATVDVTNKKTNKTETVNLTKENGAWKICMGIADKANAEMKASSDPNAPKSMDELMKKLDDPAVKEQMEKASEMMKNMKPEDIQKMKDAVEKLKDQQ